MGEAWRWTREVLDRGACGAAAAVLAYDRWLREREQFAYSGPPGDTTLDEALAETQSFRDHYADALADLGYPARRERRSQE